jgi:PTH1 family peptidyl-tRNA hydrolase
MLEANQGRKLIVGLGNPGSKYNGTRHNIGFEFVDLIAEKYGIDMTKTKFNSIYGGTKASNETKKKSRF